MPIYEARCETCGRHEDYHRPVANYMDTPMCCGQKMQKVLSAPSFIVDIPAYVSPVSGKVINSRAQRRDDLERANARPWEGFEQEQKEAKRRESYDEAKQDKKLEAAAIEAYKSLKPEQKKLLETN
jgi:hypothetical protein